MVWGGTSNRRHRRFGRNSILLEGGGTLGRPALMLAIEGGHARVVETLLAAGANPNLADFTGLTRMALALERKQKPVVARLLSAGARLPPEGLDLPSDPEHRELVLWLLELGATPSHAAFLGACGSADPDLVATFASAKRASLGPSPHFRARGQDRKLSSHPRGSGRPPRGSCDCSRRNERRLSL